jgi:hypothetical protein
MGTPAARTSPSRICSGSWLPCARGSVAALGSRRGAKDPAVVAEDPAAPRSRREDLAVAPVLLPLRPGGAPQRPLLHGSLSSRRGAGDGEVGLWDKGHPCSICHRSPPPPHKLGVEEEVREGDGRGGEALNLRCGSAICRAATSLRDGGGESGRICWPPPVRHRALLLPHGVAA